ncbi:hypothetical protein COT48_01560 [Candidatus Woesearchaeota archaeon CG08_land_8_20_14_0_20_47_9]|nr:MAG: hypothetical protein AUJ69_04570 [Candidatus Woesearchaeota archaeon CG1_02_47_18]PIN75447.1 MAG: hypothetical protein COV22_00855 [Candidatus Woesearchaeota archaeon CG10_big_fil_rev_8_21_14_0_10_47_5]PIO04223.1 MAG: hypothetical protein COT48_01560 [Candidatus Woesearchaeota archaeon CG08_land_8_20_14_0_20_47_9]HII29806.1 hypothetical protein [Candidatus Woesearchaeota archaeon]
MKKINKGRVAREAKQIMDNFIKALGRVDQEIKVGFEREEATRKPVKEKPDSEFIEAMFKNAPKSDGEHIIAEKAKW